MKVSVINASSSVYNLAVAKIAQFDRAAGNDVYAGPWAPMEVMNSGLVYFSVIFTWDLPALVGMVKLCQLWGKHIHIGGPAATFLPTYIEKNTGIKPHIGQAPWIDQVRGDFELAFTSRGCIHQCPYCGVKRVEPELIEYEDFDVAPMIGDNNILSTSWDHQQKVVEKLLTNLFPCREGVRKVDINSGFDVRLFQPEHFDLYSRLPLLYWRFAFDQMDVEADVRRVAAFMRSKGRDRHKVVLYCLFGFPGTTPEECKYRFDTIIGLGMMPYPMRYYPINRLNRNYIAPGWTKNLLDKFSIYYQTPNIWMADSWENFRWDRKKFRLNLQLQPELTGSTPSPVKG